jgi:hypothetical protein
VKDLTFRWDFKGLQYLGRVLDVTGVSPGWAAEARANTYEEPAMGLMQMLSDGLAKAGHLASLPVGLYLLPVLYEGAHAKVKGFRGDCRVVRHAGRAGRARHAAS